MEHMRENHRMSQSWTCFACANSIEFNDKQDFIEHTREEHKDAITEDQIPAITSVSAKSTPFAINACPLCKWADTNPLFLLDHIAEHVHSFSLKALPWAPSGKEEDSARMNDSAAKVKLWLGHQATQDEEEEERPRYSRDQEVEEIDDYFENNDYFAESEGRQSAGLNFSVLSEESDYQELADIEPLEFLEFNQHSLDQEPADSTDLDEVSHQEFEPLSVETLQVLEKQLESSTGGKEGELRTQ